MNRVSKFGLLFLLLISACRDGVRHQSDTDASLQIKSNGVKLQDLNGQPVDMKQFKGKTLFINFWATWCKPCLQEMPSIQKAMGVLENENIEFLFASDESIEQIEGFKTSHDFDFNYVRAENLEELNIMALPTTFIFDKKGKLVFSEMGYKKWDEKINIDLILNISK